MRLKVNRYILFILGMIFFELQGFYLIPKNIPSTDIANLIGVLFWIDVYRRYPHKVKNKYWWIILFPMILVVTSSVMAYYSYGQPILLGIRAQRGWMFPLLMYFPLNCLMKNGRLTEVQIIQAIDKLLVIYICIVFIQFAVGDRLLFLQVYNKARYGSIRLYISSSFLLLSFFIHLRNIYKKNHILKHDFFIIGLILLIVIFVIKSRMLMLTMLISGMLCIYAQKRTWKKISTVVFILVLFGIFINTDYGIMILNSIQMLGTKSEDLGAKMRDIGRLFYLTCIFKSRITAIFGCGYANIDWPNTVKEIRYSDGIYASDNGIIGLMFYYGIIFVIWFVALHIRLLIDAWKSEKSGMFFYLLFGILGIYTLFPGCYVTDISFALVCAFIENKAIDKLCIARMVYE